ncbi:pyranose 2-oxidase [Aspergillus multicolor]|uniref:pyranose 2-oxidase n=1 Tax=Aspergillus multicolor TaxID=41759 RepID=UPI003CCCA268
MTLPDEPCDVLIIGSGPIGATVAREILNPKSGTLPKSPKVIMVEAGAQESKIPGQHKKNAVVYQKHIDSFVNVIQGSLFASSVPTRVDANLKLPPVSWSPRGKQNFNGQNQDQSIYTNLDANGVSRNVGGMSTHWTCATPRQHKLERSDIFDDATWNTLYARAEKLIGTRTDVLKDSIRQQLVRDIILKPKFPTRGVTDLPLAAKKVEGKNLITWSSSATVFKHLIPDHKLDLREEHICERLELDSSGRNVKSAIVKKLAHPISAHGTHKAKHTDRIRIRPKYVVICGGPILTPQLLYNSGFRYDDNDYAYDDNNDDDDDAGYNAGAQSPFYLPALGRNLTEQTMCFCQIVLKDKWVEILKTKDWSEACRKHRKKYDETADPVQIPFDDLDPQVTLPFTNATPWHTQIHRDAFSYGALPPAIDKRTIVDLRYFGGVEPRWRNRIKFSSKLTDAYGLPQPTFDFKLSKKDRIQSHEMMKDMEKVAAELGGYLPGSEPQFLAPGLALHVCGTTVAQRRDPKKTEAEQKQTSCCDENSKVWGVDNLYLGGLNVIPGPPKSTNPKAPSASNASNPTLTAMCFAIKAAEAIQRKLDPANAADEEEDSEIDEMPPDSSDED